MTSVRPTTNASWQPRGVAPACAVLLCAILATSSCQHACAQSVAYPRVGKVLIIRGAFTVFSLGLDTLGSKLERCGVDVAVVPAFMASITTEQLADQARCGRSAGPIVLIGHSKGAHLTADCARQLQARGLAVDLVIMIDNPNRATVPANVRRCVNFYHTNMLGVFHGQPADSDVGPGHVRNIDIDRLPCRCRGGYIDHFNMDSSDWIHGMVIQEVLRVCRPCCAAPRCPPRCRPRCTSPRALVR